MQKSLIAIIFTLLFALLISGTVTAADNTTNNILDLNNESSVFEQQNMSLNTINHTNSSNTNTSYDELLYKKNNNSNSKNIISGIVLDCITYKPFPNATITVKTVNSVKVAETTTDENGLYYLMFYSNETTFNVIASALGHVSPSKQINLSFNPDNQIYQGTANFTLGQPAVTISVPEEVFINELFTLNLTFNNTGTSTGFAPVVELFLPPGVSFDFATFLGSGVTATDVGVFPVSGQLYDPVLRQTINGPVGYRLIVLEYPLGSFTPDQTPVTINAALRMGTVSIGTPLSIYAQPWFRLGNTPIDDPSIDPPISGVRINDTVTPIVMKLTKNAIIHEDETATGLNYPVTYELYLDIANGTTVTNINVTDILSGNLQFLNLITADGGSVIAQPSTSTPGGNLIINFASVLGLFGGPEKTIRYTVFAPEFNSTSNAVLDPITGYSPDGGVRNAINNATASGTYLGNTIISDGPESDYIIRLLSLATQKGVTLQNDPQGNGYSPGDSLEYTINFQISDYFAFKNLVITDVVGDGQTFNSSFVPVLRIVENGTVINIIFDPAYYSVNHNSATGETTIVFNVSGQLAARGIDSVLTGGLYDNRTDNRGATTGYVVFRTIIDTMYEGPVPGDNHIGMRDTTSNNVEITGDILESDSQVSDGSGTTVTMTGPSILKTIYAIDGNTAFTDVKVKAGMTVTYSLEAYIYISTTEGLYIVDYLPIPFLNATQVTTQIAQGDGVPGAGQWRLADDDTLSAFLGSGIPWLMVNGTENSLIFCYGSFNDTLSEPRKIHILFTVTATNEPFADSLTLANMMTQWSNNTFGQIAQQSGVVNIITQTPNLVITKGVNSTTGSGTINPPSTVLPVNGNLSGADAGDVVTYIITVENQGSAEAYDVNIRDSLPIGLTNLVLVSVKNGLGADLSYTGDLLSGLRLTNPLAANDGSKGSNFSNDTAFIIFTCTIDNTVYPRQVINNQANITNFASTPGGPNFVQDQNLFTDNATVTIAPPTIVKALTNSSDPNTLNRNLTIGEVATFRLNITLPEGQVTNLTVRDLLPNGFAYVPGSVVIDTSGFAGTLATLNVAYNDTSRILTVLFDGLTNVNPNNDLSDNSFYVYFNATVLNSTVNNRGNTKNNNANLTWVNNPDGQVISNTVNMRIVEPNVTITKSFTPNPADAGDTVTVTFTVRNTGSDVSYAYDVCIIDPLDSNVFDLSTVSELYTPTGFTYSFTSPNVIYIGGSIANGATLTFNFTVKVRADISPNRIYPNTAYVNSTSINGTDANERNYTTSGSSNLQITVPTINKILESSSEPTTAGNNLTIGEVATFKFNIYLPDGQTTNLKFIDILPVGFAYMDNTVVVNTTGFSGTLGSPMVILYDAATRTLNITFNGTTIVPEDFNPNNNNFTITFNATVLNNPVNSWLNPSKTNHVNMTWDENIAGPISDSLNLNIVEPHLVITKTLNSYVVDAGDHITVTMRVQNTGNSTAFDVNVVDILNGALFDLSSVSEGATPAGFTFNYNPVGGTVNYTGGSVTNGTSVEFTFTVNIRSDLHPGLSYNNTANVTGYSLPITTLPNDERRQYTNNSTVNINTVQATIEKTLESSSEPTTTSNNLTIGEVGTFKFNITLPEGQLTNVVLVDSLPIGFEYVPGSVTVDVTGFNGTLSTLNPTISYNSAIRMLTVVFTGVTIVNPNNDPLDNSFVLRLNATVLNSTSNSWLTPLKVNTVSLDWDENEGSPATDTLNLNIVEPSLVVTKTMTPDTVLAGNYVNIRFDITNVGNSTAFDLIVKDILDGNIFDLTTVTELNTPTGFTYAFTSPSVTYTGGSLANGSSIFFTFTAKIRPDVANGVNHENTVNVTSCSIPLTTNPNNERRSYENNSSDILNILTSADIYVLKSGGPDPVVPGRNVTYSIVVGNVGPSDAQDVTLVDVVPGVVLSPMFSLDGGVSWSLWSGSYTWSGAFVPGASRTVLITGVVNPSTLSSFTNTATVSSTTTDPYPENNTNSSTIGVDPQADIFVIKSDSPDPVIPGRNITYTIVVGNVGPSDAQDVTLVDAIPGVVVNPLYSLDNGISWNFWTGFYLWSGAFAANSNVTILIQGTVDPSASGSFTNTATVSSQTIDPYPENNTSTAETLIKTADIAVTKLVNPTKPNYLGNVTYTITVTNNGPDSATDVEITDILPVGLKLLSIKTSQGTYHNGVWTIGTIENKKSATLTIIAQVVKSNTTIENTAIKTGENEYDPDLTNNNATANITVASAANLSVVKSVNNKRPTVGKIIYFTMIVQNRGPDTATKVNVREVMPDGLSFISYTANYGTYNPKTGIWTIGDLPANTIAKLTIKSKAVKSGNYVNKVQVESLTYDPIIDDNTDSVNITVKAAANHTVPMQQTGMPAAAMVMALLMVFAGMLIPKWKK
ncbi:DUF11 domain-containing protein [Methanobacterium alcaliphilum]|uniref:COG1361 S-layer family protein n=1 Tax=Methanobacterium alcaliphilum TaxID=392018 RepID=UPI002009F214|nr:DUF11 domain-containing protein [Methanobacterium alcaliphilum]MCK9150582.1 DUF11 domain-containing protein [Methanobacterium alcaliphilum]